MAGFTTGIITALSTPAVVTAASTVATAATAYSMIKSSEASQAQGKQIKSQQKKEAAALKEQKAKQLAKRKELIDKKRRQIFGVGDDAGERYDIGQTGAVGVLTEPNLSGGKTLTGEVLG